MTKKNKGGKTMPLRAEVVSLDGEWEGWNVTIRKNASFGQLVDQWTELDKADVQEPKAMLKPMYDLLALLVVDWDYVDSNGDPLPPNMEGFKALPYDLLVITIRAARKAAMQLPFPEAETLPDGSIPMEDLENQTPPT